MKNKLFGFTAAIMIAAGGTYFAMNGGCPLKGTIDCPATASCPLKGTAECPMADNTLAVAECCKK